MAAPSTRRPLVSAIIVNYNSLEFLKPCVAALRQALAGLDSEILVVDNASTDGSREWLASTQANNRATGESGGRYVLLLNPDTVPTGDSVRALVTFLDAPHHASVGAAGPTVTRVDGSFYRQCARNFPDPRSGAANVFPWLAPWISPSK